MKFRRRNLAGSAAMLLGGVLATLAASPARAATHWYVEGNNPQCSNRGSGSSSTPFCTIQTAAKKALAGDTITVRPGIYREEVTPMASGNPGLPITFKSSAPGVVILGTQDVSSPGRWTTSFHTSWKQAINFVPTQVFLDGTRLANAPSKTETTPNSFFFDAVAKVLYVDIGGPNPGINHVVEAGARLYAFNIEGVSGIVIDGFTMRFQNLDGLRIADASSITARNLDISYTGAYGVHTDGSSGPLLLENCTVASVVSNGILIFNTTGATVRNNITHDNGFHGISLQGSSSNFVTGNTSFSNTKFEMRSAAGMDVSMGSTDNVIQANTVYSNQDSGMQIYDGSNGNIVARNVSWSNGDHGFDTNGSVGTRYVSNTSYKNYKDGFSVEGGSTGTMLENNIASDNGLTTSEYNLYVDQLSAAGFSSDYNLMWRSTPGRSIRFNGVFYQTLTDYSLGTGKDVHGLTANPRFLGPAWGDLRLSSGSPAIDSADADAPGFVNTDRFGFPLADDPMTANTGRGLVRHADRGAFECDPPPVAFLTLTPARGVAPLHVFADASRSLGDDPTPIATYRFDFNDGRLGGAQPTPTTNHTFMRPGLYRVTVTVTDRAGQSTSYSLPVTVQKAAADTGVILGSTPNFSLQR